jgi:hypothetical protein
VDARPLAGTENAVGTPFWSPDSRYIVFYSEGKLQKIEASGGPVQTLCHADGVVYGGFWTRDNRIVFGMSGGLLEVNAAGGVLSALTNFGGGEIDFPALLPDGHHFLYLRYLGANAGGIYLGSLDAKPNEQAPKKLLADVSAPVHVPSMDPTATTGGYVLFVRGGTLMAQPFDDRRLDMAGEAVPIAERVSSFSASANGALVYLASAPSAGERLTWLTGKAIRSVPWVILQCLRQTPW